MILICSASYVSSDIRNYFGKIPPVFLPHNNKTLIEEQINSLRNSFPDEKIYLILPEKFKLNEIQSDLLNELNVKLIFNIENISLSQSILLALEKIKIKEKHLILLHGDTLILDKIDSNFDQFIGISTTKVNHSWKIIGKNKISYKVWCGIFKFSNVNEFSNFLRVENNFENSVDAYFRLHKIYKKLTIKHWLDFGNINSFFKSRTKRQHTRIFNSLSFNADILIKKSQKSDKIIAEYNWYSNLPQELNKFTPKIISSKLGKNAYYEMEYLYGVPLNEILIFGNQDEIFWNKIFVFIKNYFAKSVFNSTSNQFKTKNEREYLIEKKTKLRWNQFSESNNDIEIVKLNNDEYHINKIINECISLSYNLPSIPGYLHGDLCFSNIIYLSNSDNIKVIDPRGFISQNHEVYCSDLIYDVAKLSHSVIGGYDFIIANQYEISFNKFGNTLVIDYTPLFDNYLIDFFNEKKIYNNIKISDTLPLVVLLFISMLPLHNENINKQMALLANALILYKKLK
jgi:hypothetical protein